MLRWGVHAHLGLVNIDMAGRRAVGVSFADPSPPHPYLLGSKSWMGYQVHGAVLLSAAAVQCTESGPPRCGTCSVGSLTNGVLSAAEFSLQAV